MHIAQLRLHPTDPNIVIVAVPSVLNTAMGRFEPARLSNEHKGYLVHARDIDALGRFLRIENIAIVDERANLLTDAPPRYSRQPNLALKCGQCGYTQREDSCHLDECGNCRRCHNCRANELRSHTIDRDEQIQINQRGMVKARTELAGRTFVKGVS